MKKFVLAVLPLTVLLTGCQNICDINSKLKPEAARLGVQIHAAMTGTPDVQKIVCEEVNLPEKGWDTKLVKVAKALTQTANRDLRYVEEVCTRSHVEQRCSWVNTPYPRPGFPGDYPQEWRCINVNVCDSVQRVDHKRPGYEEALALAEGALELRSQLRTACDNVAAEKTVEAILNFVHAKIIFEQADQKIAQIDAQASCSERKGY